MNDVATKNEQNEVALDQEIEFGGPLGFEGVDPDCVTIPFLKLAQATTEQAKNGGPEYMKGLQPGQFFCPTTRKIYGEEIHLIVLRFYRQFVIYDGEDTNSKFLGTMSPEDFAKIEHQTTRVRSYFMLDGKRYVDNRNFIVMVSGALHDGPMLLTLSSTGISPSKKWLTQMQNFRTPDGKQTPIWANVWALTSGFQKNEAGQTFYQISRIDRLGFVPKDKAIAVVIPAFNEAMRHSVETIQTGEEIKDAPDQRQSPAADVGRVFGAKAAAEPTGTEDEVF